MFASEPDITTGSTGQPSVVPLHTGQGQSSSGACAFPRGTDSGQYEQLSDDNDFDRSEELSISDDGQLSDSTEVPEQTEEMSYRETVRSVRAYMGWHHIPTFETTYSEPDKSNNPWKGKNSRKPTRVSVAMPRDDWLCQKLEKLNLTAVEGQSSSGACAFPPGTDSGQYEQLSDDNDFDRSEELLISDDGQLSHSDSTEVPEQTEEMSYRETVRSVRAYMGWHHIPTFESTYSEPDKSNNPWKGKNPRKPTRVSVAMPRDDWLCQKVEKLNLTAVEGYPSRSQDAAGLKRDQFIKVPKSQSKWYTMQLLKPDGPHRPENPSADGKGLGEKIVISSIRV